MPTLDVLALLPSDPPSLAFWDRSQQMCTNNNQDSKKTQSLRIKRHWAEQVLSDSGLTESSPTGPYRSQSALGPASSQKQGVTGARCSVLGGNSADTNVETAPGILQGRGEDRRPGELAAPRSWQGLNGLWGGYKKPLKKAKRRDRTTKLQMPARGQEDEDPGWSKQKTEGSRCCYGELWSQVNLCWDKAFLAKHKHVSSAYSNFCLGGTSSGNFYIKTLIMEKFLRVDNYVDIFF